MPDEDKGVETQQDIEERKPEGFPGKVPGEGAAPAAQDPMDDHGGGDDADGSEAVGDGPSGGAVDPPNVTSDEAAGAGPSGGASE